ncbi:hypothetical protein MNB_SV-12-405 [hydrothermal vent metagenome]|uniref:Uncharacterized protein n=1 Tax=hydrothermal vent metagenome TaxID=652676 RepID=A0A1W1CCZ6_9ZZZZ
MKEVLIVILSAVVGYIVLSAFSVSDTPGEAVRRILDQSKSNTEVQLTRIASKESVERTKLQEQTKQIQVKEDANVKIEEIEGQTKTQIATINANSSDNQKAEDNKMLIAISLLAFILIYIYLKYQRTLAQDELEKEKEYKDMLAKKEYAERILAIVATGNISVETEHKLLKILDELNNPQIHINNPNNQLGRHPNPDIEQLPLQRNR